MIEASNVCLTYSDGTTALKDVNLNIMKGQMIYITGPSGSGKTSLLKLLMGIEYPTEGKLEVLGQAIEKSSLKKIKEMRKSIGPVFQEFRLIKGRTAIENVLLGMRFLNISHNNMKEYAEDALKRVGLLNKSDSLVDNLSWGECQRVAIARAVARKPQLILADEPTGNLDTANAMNIIELLNSFKDKKTTVIVTTHATHLIDYNKADMIIKVDNGRISCEKVG